MKRSTSAIAQVKPNGLSTIRRRVHRSLRAAGMGTRPIVAVFGSSQPRRDDELYKSSLLMGELLGRLGFDVMTGGYKGVMEAVTVVRMAQALALPVSR